MYRSTYGRIDKLLKEKRHDAYQERTKWPSPTRCTKCDVIFVNGRWTWDKRVDLVNEHTTICPACRRINDNYPAGLIELKGPFLEKHRREILNLIKNTETQEKTNHPMERLMNTELEAGCLYVTTTGIHLARRIGEALAKAYRGELQIRYGDEDHTIRVGWER